MAGGKLAVSVSTKIILWVSVWFFPNYKTRFFAAKSSIFPFVARLFPGLFQRHRPVVMLPHLNDGETSALALLAKRGLFFRKLKTWF